MIRETECHGWKALALSTKDAELVFPTEVGPRVISCSLAGKGNLFATLPEHLGGKGEADFKVRGGHRLLIAPESPERTYRPDNDPVEVKILGENGLVLTQKADSVTGIEKSLGVEALNATSFRVTHTVANRGAWPATLAPWALSVLRHDGYTALPFSAKKPHTAETLLPSAALVMWPYTDLSLPQWKIFKSFVGVDVSLAKGSQKIGITNFPGWIAHWTPEGTFVKFFRTHPGAVHPDMGCRAEIYTCDWMTEMESLGLLEALEPGAAMEHVEYWGLFQNLPRPDSEAVFTEKFRPVIENWLSSTRA
jgi:hypothetical protein